MAVFDDAALGSGSLSVFSDQTPATAPSGYAEVCLELHATGLNKGMLTQLKFNIASFTSARSNYAGKLFVEASNDFSSGLDDIDLVDIGPEIHEGYNYYTDDAWDGIRRKQFRIATTQAGGCADISDIQFIG